MTLMEVRKQNACITAMGVALSLDDETMSLINIGGIQN